MSLGIGIIGCGKMGRVFGRWFSERDDCEIRALFNRTRQRAELFGQDYPSAKIYENWRDLVTDKDVHVVCICTPSHEHKEQFISCMQNNKHALCEKPMANDFDSCREMYDEAQKSNATSIIGFQMRYHPVIQAVNEALQKIDKILFMEINLTMYRPEVTWKHKLDQGGGVMKELASHLIDLGRMWCGNVTQIYGHNIIFEPEREVEDYSACLIKFENGSSCVLKVNYWDRDKSCISGKLIGKEGQIEFQFSSYDPQDSKAFFIDDGERTPIDILIPDDIDHVYPGHLDSFKKETEVLVNAIKTNTKMPESITDGVKAMEVIGAAYLSSKLNKSIELPLKEFNINELEQCFERYTGR